MPWSTEQTHRIVEQFWQNGVVRCPDDNGPLKLKLHKLHGGDYDLHAECPVCGKRKEFRVRPVNTARRLVRYAVRPCKDRPRPVFRSFDVFVAATPISGGTFTSGIDSAGVAAARMNHSLSGNLPGLT